MSADPNPSTAKQRFTFTVFDAVGVSVGALGLPFALVASWKGPQFAALFADLGTSLPAFTQLCLKPWIPILLGVIPISVAALTLFAQPARGGRVAAMVFTLLLALSVPTAYLMGLYLPIFEIAGHIK